MDLKCQRSYGLGDRNLTTAKLLHACNLPLTGSRCVDMVITDLGVFTIDRYGSGGMVLVELADGVTLDDIKSKTEATFQVGAGMA